MVRKKTVKKSPGRKTRGSSAGKQVAKTVAGDGAKKKKTKKKAGTGKGTGPRNKVNAEKKMTSKMKSEKEAATMLEELLPADSTGEEKGHSTEKKKVKVKFKSMMLREEAISYFEAIISGLKRGSIQIRQGDDAIVLKPTPQLDVAVKARSKEHDESIEFEIKWRTATDSELTISSG